MTVNVGGTRATGQANRIKKNMFIPGVFGAIGDGFLLVCRRHRILGHHHHCPVDVRHSVHELWAATISHDEPWFLHLYLPSFVVHRRNNAETKKMIDENMETWFHFFPWSPCLHSELFVSFGWTHIFGLVVWLNAPRVQSNVEYMTRHFVAESSINRLRGSVQNVLRWHWNGDDIEYTPRHQRVA